MMDKSYWGNWKRRLSQLLFLGVIGEFSFYGVFRCPFAVPYVGCGNCPVLQCPGRSLWLPVWIGLLISAIALGRAFCGWGCPGGLLSDLLSKLALFRVKVRNRLETASKLTVAAACILLFFVLNNPRWAIPIRTGEFFNSVRLTFEHASPFWLERTAFILAGIALAVLIPHFWCRFLCPTGGLLELFGKISLVKYYKTAACNECDRCRAACMAGTRPAEAGCTNCGDCIGSCPAEAIEFGRPGKPPPEENATQQAA
jgi:ferredoxin-type protein NapH